MLKSIQDCYLIGSDKVIPWPIPQKDELLVVTPSGVLEIGKNMTLYGHDGRWIGVDAGVGFIDGEEKERLGASDNDVMVLDQQTLKPVLDRVSAFFITHAHEDHIGAIAYYWANGMTCPIYCTPFARGLISYKLEEAGLIDKVELRVFQPGDTIEIDGFSVETVLMTHSIPEPVALAISTSVGTVVHTGDWKIDNGPALGGPMDAAALARIGEEGVLAVVSDSTNACKPGWSPSEASVATAVSAAIRDAQGAVVVACFASNVGRVAAIAKAGIAAGRKVALAGRSMQKANLVANQAGLLNNLQDFLAEPKHLHGLDEREKLLICTGTQGEPRSVLPRMAHRMGGRHFPDLEPGTTVVFSGGIIPGNEGSVAECVEALEKLGCKVLMGTDKVDGHPLHVTGHCHAEELRHLYTLLRPRFALPVHGSSDHMVANGAIALETGVVKVALSGGGSVTRFTRDNLEPESLGRIAVESAILTR